MVRSARSSLVAAIVHAVVCLGVQMSVAAACLAVPGAWGAESVLVERRSAYNTIQVTETDRGLRVLRFEPFGARQSVAKPGDPDHLELAYTRALPIAFALIEAPRRILVVGLGGAVLPMFLRKRVPDATIDVVEIDPEVLAVAKSHFGFREDARMRAHVADGRRFVEARRDEYDLVILDAFGKDSIPYSLATREFLESVRAATTARGVVVGNLWGRSDNVLYDSMIRTYRDVFEAVSIVDVAGSGNKLVLACSCRPMPTPAAVTERAREIGRRMQLRHDLAAMAAAGYREPGRDGETGRVLLDATPP